jgi:hypothetical protein
MRIIMAFEESPTHLTAALQGARPFSSKAVMIFIQLG